MTPLSPREQEVLIEASWGLTARQSAEELRVAVSTVKTHRRHICLKLQVPNIRRWPGSAATVPASTTTLTVAKDTEAYF